MPITTHDLNRLIKEPSPRVRSHIAAKVSESFLRSQFTSNETKLAIEIFRLLLRDTSSSVRYAISNTLKSSSQVPHDIVLALCYDEAEIAVPMLEDSQLLTDEDLVELIATTRELRKWMAVTRRASLSRRVSHSLAATGSDEVVASLLANDGAEIAEEDLEGILQSFSGEQSVLEALVCRGSLSPRFAEHLYAIVSGRLKKQLTKKSHLPWMLGPQIDGIRESAMLRFLSPYMSDAEVSVLISQMHKNKRLSDRMIMRALLSGELRFAEMALATRADIPLATARNLTQDRGTLGFRTLYLAAGMPEPMLETLDIVLRFAQKEASAGRPKATDYTARLLAHLREGGHDARLPQMTTLLQLIDPVTDARILH